MEAAALVAEALLASAERPEVFSRLRDNIVEEVEVDAAALVLCVGITQVSLRFEKLPGRFEGPLAPAESVSTLGREFAEGGEESSE